MQSVQVAVDIVIFTIQSGELRVLLVKRGIPPFLAQFAIPGGFVLENESLDQAALRELKEETGVGEVYLEQLYSFGDPGRDPRGRVITVAYYALIAADRSPLVSGSDASDARWWVIRELPPLAFDHRKILDYALERLRNKLEYTTVGFQLYQDAGHTTLWGNTQGTNTASGTGTGSAQSIVVYGQVPAQTTPKPDTYQTTITATVYF